MTLSPQDNMSTSTGGVVQFELETEKKLETYKVYKQRWLILFASFCILFLVGLHKSLIPIADVLEEHLEMSADQYALMIQVPFYTIVLSVIGIAGTLDHFGLRRSAHASCIMIIAASGLKALACAEERYLPMWIKDHRFAVLILSEVFVGLIQSLSLCMPAKLASDWFAVSQHTLAFVIAYSGFNIGMGVSNYWAPILVQSGDDMYKLSYLFIVSGVLTIATVLACVTSSVPRKPPSSNAVMSASAHSTSLKDGLIVMLSNPSYVLLLLTLALNISVIYAEQSILEDITSSQHYSNSFCGSLIAVCYIPGCFCMLISAVWIDKSTDCIRIARIASIICASCNVFFNMSVLFPNIETVILVGSILTAFGTSLLNTAFFQVSIRASTTILPEATVSAVNILLIYLFTGLIVNLLRLLKMFSPETNPYQAPMITISVLIVIVSVLFTATFTFPKREELQRKLAGRQKKLSVTDNEPEDALVDGIICGCWFS